jgi:hypothetical protein
LPEMCRRLPRDDKHKKVLHEGVFSFWKGIG